MWIQRVNSANCKYKHVEWARVTHECSFSSQFKSVWITSVLQKWKVASINSALQEPFCPSRERLLTAATEHIQAHLTFDVFYVLLWTQNCKIWGFEIWKLFHSAILKLSMNDRTTRDKDFLNAFIYEEAFSCVSCCATCIVVLCYSILCCK